MKAVNKSKEQGRNGGKLTFMQWDKVPKKYLFTMLDSTALSFHV